MDHEFSVLVGKTLASIEGGKEGEDEVYFTTEEGRRFKMYHRQVCCESVYLAEVIGDIGDLIGSPILQAEEAGEAGEETDWSTSSWTFYKLATVKGSVTLRWYGASNGNYSESVIFEEQEG